MRERLSAPWVYFGHEHAQIDPDDLQLVYMAVQNEQQQTERENASANNFLGAVKHVVGGTMVVNEDLGGGISEDSTSTRVNRVLTDAFGSQEVDGKCITFSIISVQSFIL